MSGIITPSASGRPRWTNWLLIALACVVFFAAGVGVSLLLRDRGTETPDPAATNRPGPCTTASVIPGQSLPKPGTVSINVYNATDRTGLAASTASTLKGRGFLIGKVANDPLGKAVAGTAELRYGPSGLKNAQLLKFYVLKAKLVNDKRTDASVDVVNGEKFAGVQSQDAVSKALSSPETVVTGPGCDSSTPLPTGSSSP